MGKKWDEGMQGGRVQGGREEDNMQSQNECRDAVSQHAALKQDDLIVSCFS